MAQLVMLDEGKYVPVAAVKVNTLYFADFFADLSRFRKFTFPLDRYVQKVAGQTYAEGELAQVGGKPIVVAHKEHTEIEGLRSRNKDSKLVSEELQRQSDLVEGMYRELVAKASEEAAKVGATLFALETVGSDFKNLTDLEATTPCRYEVIVYACVVPLVPRPVEKTLGN